VCAATAVELRVSYRRAAAVAAAEDEKTETPGRSFSLCLQ
jgi:hypothetical protein